MKNQLSSKILYFNAEEQALWSQIHIWLLTSYDLGQIT